MDSLHIYKSNFNFMYIKGLYFSQSVVYNSTWTQLCLTLLVMINYFSFFLLCFNMIFNSSLLLLDKKSY